MRSPRGGPALVLTVVVLATLLTLGCAGDDAGEVVTDRSTPPEVRPLPPPATSSDVPLEEAIGTRRSIRDLDTRPLSDAQVGQLLWATQGITDPAGLRAAPSAGATYPLEVYVVTAQGVARYEPERHSLVDHLDEDRRAAVAAATRGQAWVEDAPLLVVLAGVPARTAQRYGDRADRYVLLEAGHAAQNLLLQATAIGLAGTPVGAFDDAELTRAVELAEDEVPLYLVPIGHPADGT